MGNAVILIPEHDSWQTMIDSLALFSDDFMDDRIQPPMDERESAFE
jgi:antitoxin VapB